MELGAAPIVSVPPHTFPRSACIKGGQGRLEPHSQSRTLNAKKSVYQPIFTSSALWQEKLMLGTATFGSINAIISLSEPLFDSENCLHRTGFLKCCVQRRSFLGISLNVFHKSYGYAHRRFCFQSSCNCTKARSSRLRDKGSQAIAICMSGIAEIGNTVSMNWRPAVEEILLLSSIALAYIAGIATTGKNTHSALLHKFRRKEGFRVEQSMPASTDERWTQDNKQPWGPSFSANMIWDRLQQKIETAAIKVESEDIGSFRARKNVIAMDLCLQAIYQAPRLRLMLSTLEVLRKEVGQFTKRKLPIDQRSFSEEVLECLCSCIAPVLQQWLSCEHFLSKAQDKAPQNGAFARIPANFDRSYIYNYLERTGKAQLYADFFFFIFHNTIRSGSCCSHNSFRKHAGGILEDIVITVAEGAAEQYLGLLANNAIECDDNEWPSTLLPAIISTRSLETFRNQVALRSWFHENFASVTAIYEDRMELWMLQDAHAAENTGTKQTRTKRSGLLEQDPEKYQGAEIAVAPLAPYSIPMKRIKELQRLSGWRYYYSLYLEFIDIAGPVLKVMLSKLGEVISFLLVCLIGRSLGLVYQGIRQSIPWVSK